MLTRRALFKAIAGFGITTFGFTGYALGVEPWSHRIVRYRPRLPKWPDELKLRIALVADVHACDPDGAGSAFMVLDQELVRQ